MTYYWQRLKPQALQRSLSKGLHTTERKALWVSGQPWLTHKSTPQFHFELEVMDACLKITDAS